MNYNFISEHNDDLNIIVDASIPNKAQNQAVKAQIARACDKLMSRIESESLLSEDIKRLVNRFLSWKLPENFNPDGGISFKKIRNENTDFSAINEPTGTNLLNADQAEDLIRYLLG